MKTNIFTFVFMTIMAFGIKAQTVFLEDFNEGSTFPEGWELNACPMHGSNSDFLLAYRLAESNWCLGGGNELNTYYYGPPEHKNLPSQRIEIISPILDLSDYEYLNFTADFYRNEFDIVNSETPIILCIKNSQMEEWEEIYEHVYCEFSRIRSVPFICSLDSSVFRKEGFQFILVLDEIWNPNSSSLHWFNFDNIMIEVPSQIDLAIFDDYPNLHIPQDSLFSPKVRLVNSGIETADGIVRCSIREHQTNELVYSETIDIPEMERMDTLSLYFPAFDMPYLNHLYHLSYELECEGDNNSDNNLISYEVDTYKVPFHNWPALNILYSQEYSLGVYEKLYLRNLQRSLDTLEQIKEILPKVSVVNYLYDDVPDSLDCMTAVSFMRDLGMSYSPTTIMGDRNCYIPRFSLFPREAVQKSVSCLGIRTELIHLTHDKKEKQEIPAHGRVDTRCAFTRKSTKSLIQWRILIWRRQCLQRDASNYGKCSLRGRDKS